MIILAGNGLCYTHELFVCARVCLRMCACLRVCVCDQNVALLTLRPDALKSLSVAFCSRTDTRFSSSDIRPIELIAPQSPLPTRPILPGMPTVRLNHRLMENSLKESYALEKYGIDIDEPTVLLK